MLAGPGKRNPQNQRPAPESEKKEPINDSKPSAVSAVLGDCTLGDYIAGVLCGPVEVSKKGGLTFSTSGPCGFSITINGGGGFGGGRGGGGGGGGNRNGGGGSIATVPFVFEQEGCDPCTKEIVDCVVAGKELIPVRKAIKVVTDCPKTVKDSARKEGIAGLGSALEKCYKTIWDITNKVKDVIECIKSLVDCKQKNSLLQRGSVDRGALALSADLAEPGL